MYRNFLSRESFPFLVLQPFETHTFRFLVLAFSVSVRFVSFSFVIQNNKKKKKKKKKPYDKQRSPNEPRIEQKKKKETKKKIYLTKSREQPKRKFKNQNYGGNCKNIKFEKKNPLFFFFFLKKKKKKN